MGQIRLLVLAAVWMSLTFLWTPGPFGDYLLSVLPLCTVAAGIWIDGLIREGRLTRLPRFALIGAAIGYLALPVGWLYEVGSATNHLQCRAMRLGQQLTESRTRVFDWSGMLVTRPDVYRFHTRLSRQERERFRDQLPPLVETLAALRPTAGGIRPVLLPRVRPGRG